ncbi:hypothetical protein, partial [Cronobacter sakazakii]|uniref:hypothetical protein n=1 Tax=Cronobacter sakazakii TaxID=28141 RepID=UPI001F21528E
FCFCLSHQARHNGAFFIVFSPPAITKINPLKSATVTRFIPSQYIPITHNNERSQCEVLRFSAWLIWGVVDVIVW